MILARPPGPVSSPPAYLSSTDRNQEQVRENAAAAILPLGLTRNATDFRCPEIDPSVVPGGRRTTSIYEGRGFTVERTHDTKRCSQHTAGTGTPRSVTGCSDGPALAQKSYAQEPSKGGYSRDTCKTVPFLDTLASSAIKRSAQRFCRVAGTKPVTHIYQDNHSYGASQAFTGVSYGPCHRPQSKLTS